MYLLYLDESGDVTNWRQQSNFVIAGVGVYEFRLKTLGAKIRDVQRKYFPGIPVPIVFHATDIHAGKDLFRKLAPQIREGLLLDLYNIIADNRFQSVLVFGACIAVDSAKNAFMDRSRTFEEVVSGFNSFLVDNYRQQKLEGADRVGNKGIVIIDKNREEQYKTLLDTFQEEGTKYGYLANIIDIPYFARCKDTPMLQLADLCSYAFFRYYEKDDDTYLKIISPRIYVNPDDKMFGLKHITSLSCDCLSCSH